MKRRAMIRSVVPLGAAIFGGLGLAACREEPIRQPVSLPFDSYGTLQDRSAQISRAATERGWLTRPVNVTGAATATPQITPQWGQPGANAAVRSGRAQPAIEATYNRDGHNVVVLIVYNQNNFSVRYVSSVGLNYDGQNIHSYYNSQVDQLVRQIQRTSA